MGCYLLGLVMLLAWPLPQELEKAPFLGLFACVVVIYVKYPMNHLPRKNISTIELSENVRPPIGSNEDHYRTLFLREVLRAANNRPQIQYSRPLALSSV